MRIEAEAFGVLITRRPMATENDLTAYETARLLDVLFHAREFIGQCDEEPRQFNMWVLPSDACDSKARNLWLQLEVTTAGYHIRMTDE